MSDIISQTVIPAQPGFFRLWAFKEEGDVITYRKEAVIAWIVSVEGKTVSSDPIGIDPTWGEQIGKACAILRPDGMVEEADGEIQTLDAWLADPGILERFL